MKKKRKQLSLFLNEPEASSIENIRKRFNPKQYALIRSHITLCREDEIEPLERVLVNMEKEQFQPFTLKLAQAQRFSQGKGVYIPVEDEQQFFQNLRKTILAGIHDKPRMHEPHITLIHPRNGTCEDWMFDEIIQTVFPAHVKINSIRLIEQYMGKPWKVVKTFTFEHQAFS
jgi:2'-5' RNA ligase